MVKALRKPEASIFITEALSILVTLTIVCLRLEFLGFLKVVGGLAFDFPTRPFEGDSTEDFYFRVTRFAF